MNVVQVDMALEEHFPEPCAVGGHGPVWCAVCMNRWPCPPARVASAPHVCPWHPDSPETHDRLEAANR